MNNPTSQQARYKLADTACVLLTGFVAGELPGFDKLAIHWDDCDMEGHRFWFHFHAPVLMGEHVSGDGHARRMSGLIRRAMTSVRRNPEFAKHPQYTFRWQLESAPKKETDIRGFTKGLRYETASWIYILNITSS